MDDLRQIEHKRIRNSVTVTLIACAIFVVAVFFLIGGISYYKIPQASHNPGVVTLQWLRSMSTLSNELFRQASPVSTSLTVATIAVALVLACSFGRRPEADMLKTEVIRLRFLESVTGAFCMIGGAILTTLGAILPFAGSGAAAGAATALGSGLLTLCMGAMIPVPPTYWEATIESERTTVSRLRNMQRTRTQSRSTKGLWIRYLLTSTTLRAVWILGYIAYSSYALEVEFEWQKATFTLIAATVGMTAAWDAPAAWSGLHMRVWWITDRWTAIAQVGLWACTLLILLVTILQVSLQTHWATGLYLTGLFVPPFIAAHAPKLGAIWQEIRSSHLGRAIESAERNIVRYQGLHKLTESDHSNVNGGRATHPPPCMHCHPEHPPPSEIMPPSASRCYQERPKRLAWLKRIFSALR